MLTICSVIRTIGFHFPPKLPSCFPCHCIMKAFVTCTLWLVPSLRKAQIADLCCCNLSQQCCSWRSHPSFRATEACCYDNITVPWVKSGMKCGERAGVAWRENAPADFKGTAVADGVTQRQSVMCYMCDRAHSPGECGFGETTANLFGEDFGDSSASVSFCSSLLEAV